MVLNDIMKYVESEFSIINYTHCKICGGNFLTKESEIEVIDGIPYDVCYCVCSHCGFERNFEFFAPYVDDKHFNKFKKVLN